MNKLARRQRGAVTLLGALFIIMAIGIMGLVINHMAGSNISDTSAQNDAIDALFVAESGIEFASFIYASGTTPCANLAGAIGATAAGRGEFDVTNSLLVGTDCQITVQGRVSSVGAAAPDTALRTVTADLRLASSEGWAVGDQVIANWDGSNWTIQNGFINLTSVACEPANPSYCVAVGSAFGGFLGVVYRWNGANWAITDADFGRTYTDIVCPGSTCYVTSTSGAIYRYNPSLIPRLANDNSGTSVSMNGIDCTSSTDCWAVGNRTGNNFNFNRRTLGGWAGVTLQANSDHEDLLAVSCADANNCKAVGKQKGSRYTVVSFNGAGWSVESFQDTSNRADLNGVHCIAANDCWAVGDVRAGWSIVRYNGVNWSYSGSAVANPENLNDVYVSGSGGGGSAVTLIRWTEQVVAD
jgi:hypothetical protein